MRDREGPGDADLLRRELRLHGGPNWSPDPTRRSELIDALTRGLAS